MQSPMMSPMSGPPKEAYAPGLDGPDVPDATVTPEAWKICIARYPDNTFAVYSEPLDTADEARSGGTEKEPGADTIDNFEDALRATLPLYKDLTQQSEQKQFEHGFGSPKERY